MSRSGSGLFSLFFSGGDPDDRRINDVAAPKIYLEITIEEKKRQAKKKKNTNHTIQYARIQETKDREAGVPQG